jgi:flavin reductase (DIM6/NTAB) family NADH-FMN oxidoreductase RutF
VDVVFGQVVRIHVKDEVIRADGKMDIAGIRPLARLGYYDYTSVTEVFEMRIPGASAEAADGLEGKAGG